MSSAVTDPDRHRPLIAVAAACLLAVVAPFRLAAAPQVTLPEYARAFHRGDFDRAIALAGERLAGHSDDVQARILLARAEAAKGRLDAAYAGFREALRIDPTSADALYYVGITASVLAQAEYQRVLSQAPDSARAHQLRGKTLEAQGRAAEAEAAYQAALAAGPPALEVLVALGDLARSDLGRSEERLAEAMSYYSRALERAPGNYDALYGLGACHSFAGDHAQAIHYLRRALSASPDSAPAHLALGISLQQTGQSSAAVTELEAAVKLEPRMRQAYYHLGRAYQSLGRSDAAEVAFARARSLTREGHTARTAPERKQP